MTTDLVIGIDLGTSNSLLCLWRNGRSELVPNRFGDFLTPSVVGVDDAGNMLVGQPAKARLQSHPHLTAASFKRHMGSETTVKLGAQSFRAEELSAILLRQLKEDAENALGQPVSCAVITVPAYFNDVQRRAVKTAGELAGLEVKRLLNEPTAASLAFGLLNNQQQKYLTFDLGGGTFDVSIIDMFDGVVEVRSSSGDVFLGGDDFNAAILRWMQQQFPELQQAEGELYASLSQLAERLKCDLTQSSPATAELEWQDKRWQWALSEAKFAEICSELIARLQRPVSQALQDARFTLDQLDHVLLVGGATRMPLIRQTVARLFGRFPRHDLHPDQAVALGAGVQAGMVMEDSAVEDVILTDVMPYSLGVATMREQHGRQESGFFLPLIERNTFLPVSMEKTLCTAVDNQTLVEVEIYQGEGRRVKDNILLGDIKLEVPARKAGEVSIDVRFTYTLDGILEVECRTSASETISRLVIENVPGQMSAEEIQQSLQRLASLKQHPRDRPENRRVLTRCNELYRFLLGEERQQIDATLSAFEQLLETQDVRQIADFRQHLEQMLSRYDNWTQ